MLGKEEEPCIEASKDGTDKTFINDEKVVENWSSSKIIEGQKVVDTLVLGGQSNNHDSTKNERNELCTKNCLDEVFAKNFIIQN